jgi:hypothetical protein
MRQRRGSRQQQFAAGQHLSLPAAIDDRSRERFNDQGWTGYESSRLKCFAKKHVRLMECAPLKDFAA